MLPSKFVPPVPFKNKNQPAFVQVGASTDKSVFLSYRSALDTTTGFAYCHLYKLLPYFNLWIQLSFQLVHRRFYSFIYVDMRRFYKCLPTRMTKEVYPIRQPFMSLAYLVSKPLKQVLYLYMRLFVSLLLMLTDYTVEVFSIRQPFMSLAYLVSKPLKRVL